MEKIVAETVQLLAAWRTRPGGDPAKERRRLMLLALEREQIVSKAYDEEFVAERVTKLPVGGDVKALVQHALVWAWKDEELHTLYIRGRLLAKGRKRAHVYGRQLLGALGGWVSATRHHRPSGRSWPVATAVLLAGRVSGQVSSNLAAELSYRSFSRYCALNEALERSAELCYERLIELAAEPEEREQFERIHADERRHRAVFAVLARSFDGADQLKTGNLRAEIAAVSPWFLPSEAARGGPVWVREDGDVDRLLDDAGLGAMVRAKPGRVAIRTAFILGYDRADRSNVVSPELVRSISRYVRRHGATDVAVLEAPSVYERVYARRSVPEVAAYFGFDASEYRIVDVQSDQRPMAFDRGISQSTVSGTWLDADVRIVVPKLRTDPRQGGHLSLNSLVGTGTRTEKTVYAGRELDHESAIMMLLDACPPDFAVVDGQGPVATGLFGVMGCDRPVTLNRLYAGPDPVSVDWQVVSDMGIADPGAMPMLRRARHWFGRDIRPSSVHGDPGPITADLRLHPNNPLARIGALLYVYASREGEVFVPKMDTEAFPPLRRTGPVTALVRWATQRAFGLRPARSAASRPGRAAG